MIRFYFDTADGDRDTDDEGVLLASEDEAVHEAIRYAGALIADRPSAFDTPSPLEVTVRTGDRTVAVIRVDVTRAA